jgi:hypothetical protein
MAKVTIVIKGSLPQLAHVPTSVIRASMPRMVKAVKEAAQAEAPKRRGFGNPKSLVSRIGGRVEQGGELGRVWSRAPHSHLIEKGVKAHPLESRAIVKKKVRLEKRKRKSGAKSAMTIPGGGGILLRKTAYHRGSDAHPFMEPAIPNAHSEINHILASEGIKALADSIKTGIESDIAQAFR